MKSKIILVILVIILSVTITGCKNEKENNTNQEDDLISVSEECCDGCICGDTIELLKKIESAWTLTDVNSKGEYVYNRHSFINFNGTGKNRFAFFLNDDNARPISNIKGEFIINDQNEIILTPDDNKKSKITCKIGQEKNLIAILHCNNNFGTFTLQKQGKLELPTTIKDNVSKTKTIIIKYYKDNKTKTIKEQNNIDILLTAINNSKIWTGAVTTPSPLYEIRLFDSDNKIIATILYNPGNYFNIKINNKNYELTNIDKEILNNLLEE